MTRRSGSVAEGTKSAGNREPKTTHSFPGRCLSRLWVGWRLTEQDRSIWRNLFASMAWNG